MDISNTLDVFLSTIHGNVAARAELKVMDVCGFDLVSTLETLSGIANDAFHFFLALLLCLLFDWRESISLPKKAIRLASLLEGDEVDRRIHAFL
jgi:hypothetical protein